MALKGVLRPGYSVICFFLAPRALLRGRTYCAGALTADAP
jgi:hypothetical protein